MSFVFLLLCVSALACIALALVCKYSNKLMFVLASAFCAIIFVFLVFFAYLSFDKAQPSGAAVPSTRESILWVPDLNLNFAFALDPLSLLFALIISGVGCCVMLYCAGYFDRGSASLLFGLSLFGFVPVMLGLVFADNLYLLFIFWELTSVLSFLLISHNCKRHQARSASLEAFLVTAFGGVCMLVGFVLLASVAGSANISEILAQGLPTSDGRVHAALALILVGAVAKSAIFPLHFWLPGAMIAPTPVSAFLHSAAMVKAGVYIMMRLEPIWSGVLWLSVVMVFLGGAGAIMGGVVALRRYDLKSILAYGTLSQLGLLFALLAAGSPGVIFATVAYVLAHAVFKSGLFLAVGIVDKKYATRDFRRISHLRNRLPLVFMSIILLSASMAGVPFVWGFVAKEAVLDALVVEVQSRNFLALGVLGFVFVTSILTFAYTVRFCFGVCTNKKCTVSPHGLSNRAGDLPLLVACAILAALGPGFAAAAFALEGPFASVAQSIAQGAWAEDTHLPHLAFAPTPSVPFFISLCIWVLGVMLFGVLFLREKSANSVLVQDATVGLVPARHIKRNFGRFFISAHTTYRLFLLGLDRFAAAVAVAIQLGSLPIYLFGIFLTCVVVLGFGLVGALPFFANLGFDFSWAVLAFVLMGGVAAIFALFARKRFQGALLLGVGGIAQAGAFAFGGAPDLALTQVVIEIIILVAFVFVFRRLRAYHEPSSGIMPIWRVVVAGLFAMGVVLALLVFASARVEPSDGLAFGKLATEGGHGNNFVNVTLVDIRAWDTMGELLVLVAAATGVASLIFVRSRGRLRRSAGTLPLGIPILSSVLWLFFLIIILFSVYLLFVGHSLPGGGFVGGAVAGLGFVLIFLGGGYDSLLTILRNLKINAAKLLSIGLGLVGISAIGPMLVGYPPFLSSWLDFSVQYIGQFVLITSTIFDIGVYLVVLGLVLDVLRSLGAEVELRGVEDSLQRIDPAATILDDLQEAQ